MTTEKTIKNDVQEMEEKTFEGAFVVPADLMDKVQATIGELPMKFSNLLIPIANELAKCYRGNITTQIPKK